MICAGCSQEVGPRARFCEDCSAPLREAAGAPSESAPDSRARVYAALPALIAFLQREGRVSYRALAHVFNGDQAFPDAAREELTFKRLARGEHGQGRLILIGSSRARRVPSTLAASRGDARRVLFAVDQVWRSHRGARDYSALASSEALTLSSSPFDISSASRRPRARPRGSTVASHCW